MIINKLAGATKALKCAATGKAAKTVFKLKKAAPKIAVIGGSIGTAAAGIWAVKKTIDCADEVLEQCRVDINSVRANKLGPAAMAKVYFHSFIRVGSIYVGPAALEIASVTGILWGFSAVDGRLVAMTATAAALEEANRRLSEDFDGYRSALKEKFGDDFDKDVTWEFSDFAVNCNDDPKHFIDVTDPETGETKKEKVSYSFGDQVLHDSISPYAVIFDETSTEWSTDPEYNKMTLHRIQQTCNDMLNANGYLFLNDVYHELGLPHTRVGQMVGWLKDGYGDGYVDFGIYDVKAVNNRSEFINGFEPSVLLDFNVDGVIWDKI